jgi:heme ABC exporter ATP-binding subunit CcmA
MTTHMLPATGVNQPETRPRIPLGVEVVGLMRSFGPKAVLRGVQLSVERGGVLALLGANGAGKTTLLRVLATLNKPDGGTARVAGYDVVRDAAQLRRVVGYVGHQPHLYEELTARENLLFFARMYGLAQPAVRADALLARFDLRARANDRTRTLSRGQLQRLAIARGIVQEPAVLLLDEPETGLDESAFALLRALIAERQELGLTTLFTTHQIDRALHLAGEIAVLARGRIAFSASAAEVSADDVRAAVRDLTEVRR